MRLRTKVTFAALCGAALLQACATVPDPALVCSADWIKPRAARAVGELKKDTASLLKTITSSASKMTTDDGISAFQTFRMINALEKFGKQVENSKGLKDLKTLSSTCNDPKIVREGIAQYFEDIKAPKLLIDMMRDIESFKIPLPERSPEPLPEPLPQPAPELSTPLELSPSGDAKGDGI